LKKVDEGVINLWQGLYSGVGKFIPFLKLKPILYFIYKDVLKLPAKSLYESMTKYERFCYYKQAWDLNHAKKSSVVKKLFNLLTRVDIHFAVKKFMRNSPNTY